MIVAAATGLPAPRRYWAIAAMSLGTALLVIDNAIATVALPTIAADLGVDGSAVVMVVTVYQLVLVMALLPLSALGDRIGHRRLYQGGQALFASATLLCFFANSLPFLLLVRATQALGAAAALSVSSAMLRSIYPESELGRGLGINSIVIASAAAIAPTLGGLILSVAPWPWVFAAATPFALLSLLIGRALPASTPRPQPYDFAAALLCAASFGLIVTGLSSAVHGDSPVISAAVAGTGIVTAFAFVRRELDRPAPILPVDLLVKPVFALSTAAAFGAFVASMAFMLSLPFRLQHEFGFSPGEVGALLAPWPLAMMAVAPFAGALSDRLPSGVLGGLGMALSTAGLLLMGFPPADPDYVDLAWRMAVCGAGFGLFIAPNARQIVGSAPAERAASAGALVSTTRLFAQALGATALAAILALGLGRGPAPALMAAAFTLLATIFSLAHLTPAIRNPGPQELPDV